MHKNAISSAFVLLHVALDEGLRLRSYVYYSIASCPEDAESAMPGVEESRVAVNLTESEMPDLDYDRVGVDCFGIACINRHRIACTGIVGC